MMKSSIQLCVFEVFLFESAQIINGPEHIYVF